MGQCETYNFQPVGQWMGYSFIDLGAEGCCRYMNALFLNSFWIPIPGIGIDSNSNSKIDSSPAFCQCFAVANIMSLGTSWIISYKHWLLTHWSRVTHICINKLRIIGSDNSLLPGRRQVIIWTSTGTLSIGLQWNFNQNLDIFIQENAFEYVVWKMAAILSRPPCVNST